MNKYALILAGGKGSRLWPISTLKRPKQFLNLYGNEIMINETIKRIEPLFDYKNIFIVINESQKELAYRYVDNNIPRENIIIEPEAKNTSMCIFYATLKIKKARGNGVVSILSCDHYIQKEEKMVENIKDGIEIAEKDDNLVIIGIKPTYPEVGFGYIKFKEDKETGYNIVTEFKQKPNYEDANEYVKAGTYLWNSGMYIWQLDVILENFKKFLPSIYSIKEKIYNAIGTDNEEAVIKKLYPIVEALSIDKGILEKSNNIKMVKGSFEWSDIGSIKSFFEMYAKDIDGNTTVGNVITRKANNCNIFSNNNQIVIAAGTKNLNIINDNGVCLIYDLESADELPDILKELEDDKENKKYL